MEPKIDSFGLDKLEVKLEHSQVHWFICATSLDDIIVYERKEKHGYVLDSIMTRKPNSILKKLKMI